MEGSRNEAYYDGILDPKNRSRFISMAKFNTLNPQERNKLEEECLRNNHKNPIRTVGIGLNLESDAVLEKYDKLLGQPGLMQDIYEGKAKLTNEQISLIFRDCTQGRLNELRQIYGSDWDKLRANERICIHSLYFNNPRLVYGKSNFRKYIKKYIETNDVTYLKRAVKEVTKKSNPTTHHGIQNRRNAEGALLASYECPTFTSPCNPPESYSSKPVYLDETIMPLRKKSPPQSGLNSEYFIWRTEMDAKVREEHLRLEGKVFRKNSPLVSMPGADYNCRCQAEEVPDHLLIMDQDIEKKAFNLYLRTGINLSQIEDQKGTRLTKSLQLEALESCDRVSLHLYP